MSNLFFVVKQLWNWWWTYQRKARSLEILCLEGGGYKSSRLQCFLILAKIVFFLHSIVKDHRIVNRKNHILSSNQFYFCRLTAFSEPFQIIWRCLQADIRKTLSTLSPLQQIHIWEERPAAKQNASPRDWVVCLWKLIQRKYWIYVLCTRILISCNASNL